MTDLNSKQLQAVQNTEGPVLVLAGAGSGKTKVLTRRVAHLIKKGVHPLSILAITFTNKAANEMKERISLELDSDVSHMWISTFHSMCVRILRMSGKAIGFDSNFVIYDSDDSLRLIKKILESLGLKDDKVYAPKRVRSAVSKYKNADGYKDDAYNFAEKSCPELSYRFAEIVKAYENEMKKQGAMDFDDLLLNTYRLFSQDEKTLSLYQNRFKYILVDEYQDTNMIQYHLVKMLAAKHKNIFVVGDDDQSIYAFRGANIENILNFEKDYPGALVVKLEQNYRSDINILEAANCVIRNNIGRKGKRLWSEINSGEKPYVYTAQNEYDEAEFIARKINAHVSAGGRYSDIAVLYRAHTLARNIEEKLRMYSVPYRVYGGLSFYERKEIKDILAYLSLLVNKNADMAFLRIINIPKRGIGAATLSKLSEIAAANNCSLLEVALRADELLAGASFRNKIKEFANLFVNISLGMQIKSIHEIIEEVIEKTGYLEMLDTEFADDAVSRKENLEEFINSAYEFEKSFEDETATLADFMQNIALLTDMDSSEQEKGVVLMTVHAAKGLEFDTVFVAGVEEHIFPSKMSLDEDNVEEERRLCYVAITRAKRCLYLLNAQRRSYFGDVSYNPPSRFLDEIDRRFLNDITPKRETKKEVKYEPSIPKKFFTGDVSVKKPEASADIGKFSVGCRVSHKAFGQGVIMSVMGSGKQAVAVVNFDKVGEKKMFLAFAPLEVI